MNLTDREDRHVASALYVVGQLDADELPAFEAALANDVELQADVAFWSDRLLGLTQRNPAVAPSAELWTRIETALPGGVGVAAAADAAPSEQGAAPAVAAAATEPVRPVSTFGVPSHPSLRRSRHGRHSFWHSLRLWRGVSALATAVAILLATYVVQRPPEVRVYMAVLKSSEQQTGWLVQARSAGTVRLVPIDPNTIVPSNKSLQLWTQPAGASAPIPIGLLEPGQSFEIPADQLPGLAGEQLFAISLEPEGGSPTGLPTGPILFAGNTQQL